MSISPFIERLWERKPFSKISKMILSGMYEKLLKRAAEEKLPDPTTDVQEAFDAVDNSLDYWETVAELEKLLMIGYEYEEAKTDPYLAYQMEALRKEAEELGLEVVKETDLRKLRGAEERLKKVEAQLRELRGEKEHLERERRKPPAPPLPVTGLSPEDKRGLEDAYRRVFAEAGILRLPPGAEATLRDELRSLQTELAEVPRERALEVARSRVTELARSLVPLRPPPAAPPPAPPERPAAYVPAAELLGPRIPRIVVRQCWVSGCTEAFEADEDLERRVRLIPVLKADTPSLGPRYEPLLRFPPLFYMLCPEHRFEKFGYRDVWDALAFLLVETRSSMAKRLTITDESLRELGLSNGDLIIIHSRAERWRAPESPGSS